MCGGTDELQFTNPVDTVQHPTPSGKVATLWHCDVTNGWFVEVITHNDS